MKDKFSSIAAIIFLIIALGFTSCKDKIEISGENKSQSGNTPPTLNVYIENSGSMDGYMCDGSELKDALYSYISDLDAYTKETRLNYINSQIIPYKNNISSYIKDLNPQSFKVVGGNRKNSNIATMLDSIVTNMADTVVSIFVSDCILDLPEGNAKDFFNIQQITVKDIINRGRKKMQNLSVQILKMSSKFDGIYYYPQKGAEHPHLSGVERPYYIWILGDKKHLSTFNEKVPLNDLEKYGLKDVVSYTNYSDIPHVFSADGNGNVAMPKNEEYCFKVLADFSNTLLPDKDICNVNNYTFSNQSISISSIRKIERVNSQYSHLLQFSIPETATIIDGEIYFNSQKDPQWPNDETGENIESNIDKTTGIKYLVDGVADAYKNDTNKTTLKFNIKRK